jgi:YaiO family outer membrane protein
MRTAQYAGTIAVAVCLHGAAAWAAEGSALRGLKPPTDVFEGMAAAEAFSGSNAGLRRSGRDLMADVTSRPSLDTTLRNRRFTTADADYRFTLHQPIGQNVAALSEPSINTLHEVLPRYTLSSQVTRALPGGWGLGFGVRQSEYNFATSNLLSLSAERNWGSFRGAYTLYSNRAEGTGLGSTHRFEVSYLYGDRNVVGLAYTTGRDLEHAGLAVGLTPGSVRDWTLSGRHWLSPNWAFTYDLLGQEQGSLYRGPGLRLGVSRSF